MIFQRRKYDHVTDLLRDTLHWLPVRQRVVCKLCTIVYKCLHSVAPSYLMEMCQPVSSVSGCSYYVSRHAVIWLSREPKRQPYGPCSFAVSGPTSWNSLPQSFCDASLTLGQFQRRLKTSLFRLAYGRDLTALHSWLSRLLQWRSTTWTELRTIWRRLCLLVAEVGVPLISTRIFCTAAASTATRLTTNRLCRATTELTLSPRWKFSRSPLEFSSLVNSLCYFMFIYSFSCLSCVVFHASLCLGWMQPFVML